MDTQTVWNNLNSEVYFFILKKVKDKNAANDILQNSFLKIHKNISHLKNPTKVRAWVFQIVRNEIINYFHQESLYVEQVKENEEIPNVDYHDACCFDQFLNDLPAKYKLVIDLIYIEGKKQKEVADLTGLTLETDESSSDKGRRASRFSQDEHFAEIKFRRTKHPLRVEHRGKCKSINSILHKYHLLNRFPTVLFSCPIKLFFYFSS